MIASAAASLLQAIEALIWPTLFFGALALITKGHGFRRAIEECRAETRVNLSLTAVDAVLIMPALAMAIAAISQKADARGFVAPVNWNTMGALPTLLAALILGDLVGYWRHRLEHSALLWPAHAIHHSDTAMTWLTLMRFHPINRLTTSLIDSTLLLALGFPAWAAVANAMVRHWYGFFIHADLPWTYGRWGRILVSPAMHRWHHVRDERLAGKNFATLFAFWDAAFRTRHLPGPCREPLGVYSGERSLAGQLAYPFRAWAAAAARWLEASAMPRGPHLVAWRDEKQDFPGDRIGSAAARRLCDGFRTAARARAGRAEYPAGAGERAGVDADLRQ